MARVRTAIAGGLGRATLDRPEAINALDIGMVRELSRILDAWAGDPSVDVVLLDGAGDRGFCAGGDVRALHERLVAGDPGAAGAFFREEYALDLRIAEYPLPTVSIADGITMGGGIGLAAHAHVRVVTERSRLAMPETRIGLTPDVGSTWLLARAPGRIGEYLALTGATVEAADALYAGLADHLVPSDRLDGLRDALVTRADPSGPSELVLLFDETPDPAPLEHARTWIDDAFAADGVPEIVARLRARPERRARQAAVVLEELSPTSLTVTLAALRRARSLRTLREALAQDYALTTWFAETQPDLVEGIRAQLVDKDRRPRWRPARLADVDPGIVDAAFAHVPAVPFGAAPVPADAVPVADDTVPVEGPPSDAEPVLADAEPPPSGTVPSDTAPSDTAPSGALTADDAEPLSADTLPVAVARRRDGRAPGERSG